MSVRLDNTKGIKFEMKIYLQSLIHGLEFEKEFLEACKRKNIECEIFYPLDILSKKISNEECVCIGSLNCAKFSQSNNLSPGFVCNFDNFYYSTYSKYYKDLLLNDEFELMNYSDLCNLQIDEEIFVRPDSGDKKFDGGLYKSPKTELSFLEDYCPVITSSKKEISAEYRYIVIDDYIVGGGRYKVNGELETCKIDRSIPEYDFVERKVLKVDFKPDWGFVVDIAKTPDGPKLIELNSLSCSGFYETNINELVKYLERGARFYNQRKERGWDDSETWNLDVVFAQFVLPRLKRFKEIGMTISCGSTESEHNENLDKIIQTFDYISNRSSEYLYPSIEDSEMIDVGLSLFKKYYRNLWW